MSNLVTLECACGTVKGNLNVVAGSFFHVQCLCCDCQNFASNLSNENVILDKHGATDLFQTYPAYLEISEGKDNLACLQLEEKGIYRWHTTCCSMPVANTMSSPKIPFVGVSVTLMKFANEREKLEVLGPITLKAFGKYSIGEMPDDAYSKFPITFMPRILSFMLKGALRKLNRPSPFFSDDKPIVEAKVLS